jgi:hypothetical protein
MNNDWPPPFWSAWLLGLATAASVAGFMLEELGPSEGLRIAAGSLVVLVLMLVAVWYLGYHKGRNTKDE